jgi:four helix bundle protein
MCKADGTSPFADDHPGRVGMKRASTATMNVTKLEDLQIWQRALDFAHALFAVSRSVAFDRHLGLRAQLDDAADSVVSNVAEGFGQSTDRAFARYLVISRGSLLEIRAHLTIATSRGIVPAEAIVRLMDEAREIEKMILGLVRYLHRSDRKNRI